MDPGFIRVSTPHSSYSDDSEIIPLPGGSDPASEGRRCLVKNLYQGPPSLHGGITWVDEYPDDLAKKPAESGETQSYALIIRHQRARDNSKKLLVMHSIVVQSPFLKSALKSVFKGYPGITTELRRLEFSAPFQPFIHRWSDLEKATKDENDPETKEHLELFLQNMRGELKDIIAAKEDLLSHKVITFELVWTIFNPGDIIFGLENGQECCFCLRYGANDNIGYAIECENVDWNGTEFGRSIQGHHISFFEGTKLITQLEVFPLQFHPNKEQVKEKLISRGKKFQKLRGYHFKAYDGVGLWDRAHGQGRSRKFNVGVLITFGIYSRVIYFRII
jgi:hypothetical protein